MKKPLLFSIILPVYNVENYIDRCLTSLENQSYKEYEIIFVDDCGSDKSILKILKHAKNNKSIKLVQNPKNLGTYHARKLGVKNAIGDYIVFVDPDDELEINFLEVLSNHINSNNKDLIFYNVEYFPRKKFYQATTRYLPYNKSPNVITAIQKGKSGKFVCAGTAGKIYRTKLLKKVYGKLKINKNYRYIYMEDQLLYYAALLEGPSYSSLNYKGYIYYKNNSSITNQSQLQKPDLLVEQMQFTVIELKKIIRNYDLTNTEALFFNYLINKIIPSNISLLKRFENHGTHYLSHVWCSFKYRPDIKQIIRIIIYLISFKKILI